MTATTKTKTLIRARDEIAQTLRDLGYEIGEVNKRGEPTTIRLRRENIWYIEHSPMDGFYLVNIVYLSSNTVHQIGRMNRLFNDCMKSNVPVIEGTTMSQTEFEDLRKVLSRLEAQTQ